MAVVGVYAERGASFAVYSIIIGPDPERSRSSIIVALEPELSCLGYWDVESYLPRQFGDPELGFLRQGIKGIIFGCDDGHKYVGIGVTLDRVIAAQISLRRIFTLIPIFRYLAYCVLLLDCKT